MPSERYFHDKKFVDKQVILEGLEFHHLAHVMRSKAGDTVELVNGQGELAQGIIEAINKKNALLNIQRVVKEAPPNYEVVLAQAVPRMGRLDFIVEKGTELGMTQLFLFPTQRSERKQLTTHQLERLKAIAIAAMKQCGRLYLPQISICSSIAEAFKNQYIVFFGDVIPQALPLVKVWAEQKEIKAGVEFYIGPESGFNDDEIDLLKGKGALGVKLHGNILRTDTAALTALSIIQQWLLN